MVNCKEGCTTIDKAHNRVLIKIPFENFVFVECNGLRSMLMRGLFVKLNNFSRWFQRWNILAWTVIISPITSNILYKKEQGVKSWPSQTTGFSMLKWERTTLTNSEWQEEFWMFHLFWTVKDSFYRWCFWELVGSSTWRYGYGLFDGAR